MFEFIYLVLYLVIGQYLAVVIGPRLGDAWVNHMYDSLTQKIKQRDER